MAAGASAAANDKFSEPTSDRSPLYDAEAVTVGTPFARVSRALWVGTAGNVTVNMAGAGAAIQFQNVPAGTLLPVRCTQVTAFSGTAGSILALC